MTHIAMMLFSIVGKVSDSEDAKALKDIADKKKVNSSSVTKENVVQILRFFSKSQEICNGTDVQNLIEKFLSVYDAAEKEEQSRIEMLRKEFSEDNITKLKEINEYLKDFKIENPAFSKFISTFQKTLEIFDKDKVRGEILGKNHLEEVLKALQCIKDLPDNINEAIDEYFRVNTRNELSYDSQSVVSFDKNSDSESHLNIPVTISRNTPKKDEEDTDEDDDSESISKTPSISRDDTIGMDD